MEKSVNVNWVLWEKMHKKPSLWIRFKLIFKKPTFGFDPGSSDEYGVIQTWKKLDGVMYLIKEEIVK